MPPVIGTEPLSVPSGRELSVSWNLKKSQLGKFVNVAKDRNLVSLLFPSVLTDVQTSSLDFPEFDNKKIVPSGDSHCI